MSLIGGQFPIISRVPMFARTMEDILDEGLDTLLGMEVKEFCRLIGVQELTYYGGLMLYKKPMASRN